MHFRSSVQSLVLLNYHDSGRMLIALGRAAHNGGPLLTSRGLSEEEEHLLPVQVPRRNEAAHQTASTGGFQVLFLNGWLLLAG